MARPRIAGVPDGFIDTSPLRILASRSSASFESLLRQFPLQWRSARSSETLGQQRRSLPWTTCNRGAKRGLSGVRRLLQPPAARPSSILGREAKECWGAAARAAPPSGPLKQWPADVYDLRTPLPGGRVVSERADRRYRRLP